MVVDGFAGDECDYSYTLNNLTGGCNVLLSNIFLNFHGENVKNINKVYWEITETLDKTYVLQSSKDGINWYSIEQYVTKVGNYMYTDLTNGVTYYRLSGDINSEIIALVSNVNITYQPEKYFASNGILIEDIDRYKGFYIIMYSNGVYEKKIK